MSGPSLMSIPARGANPYLGLLYRHLASEGIEILPDEHTLTRTLLRMPGPPPRFVHYHWPENLYNHHRPALMKPKAAVFFAHLEFLKRRGVRVVHTLHNMAPHENAAPAFHREAKARMLALSDLVLINFEAAREALAREYGRREGVHLVPHGNYRDHYPNQVDRAEARRRLGLDADSFVFLLFGDLRRYKNIELVMSAFSRLAGEQLRLLVVGGPRPAEYGRVLREAAARDPRIVLRLGRVPDDEVQLPFRASDVAVLGQETFSSGTAVLALDFDLPLLGLRTNHVAEIALGEALREVPRLDEQALTDAMRAASRADLAQARRDATRSSLALSWQPIAHSLAALLRREAESAA